MNHAEFGIAPASEEIRDILRRNWPECNEEQKFPPQKLLDGLNFCAKAGRINISFVHPYLAEFYGSSCLELVEKLLRENLGHKLDIVFANARLPLPSGVGANGRQYASVVEDSDPFADFLTNSRTRHILNACRNACDPAGGNKLLIICGPSGSGKSHLLAAMHRAILKSMPPTAIGKYSAAEIAANGSQAWRQCQALLLDDLQELMRLKEGQTLLVPCLDAVLTDMGNCRRVVATFCGRPQELQNFSPRLANRLQAGLVLELFQPDLAMRIAYIERNAKKLNLKLSREQIMALARYVQSLGAINGLLQKMEYYAKISGQILSAADLEKLLLPDNELPDWQLIVQKVGKKLEVRPADILGTGRRHELALARQIALYFCRSRLGLSYPELGRLFGGRDHTTVLYAIRKIQQLRDVDKALHNLMTELEIELG